MILPIYIEPKEILRTPAQPVTEFNDELKTLVADMRETMHNADGIGLAAPQIGKSIRLFVAEYNNPEADPEDQVPFTAFINPEIYWRSPQKTVIEEACLSIPGTLGLVKRPRKVSVRYFTEDGTQKEKTFDELFARVIQHEYDHLEGILFTDYVAEDRRTYRKAPAYPRI